jgi:hypothetical protein
MVSFPDSTASATPQQPARIVQTRPRYVIGSHANIDWIDVSDFVGISIGAFVETSVLAGLLASRINRIYASSSAGSRYSGHNCTSSIIYYKSVEHFHKIRLSPVLDAQ